MKHYWNPICYTIAAWIMMLVCNLMGWDTAVSLIFLTGLSLHLKDEHE